MSRQPDELRCPEVLSRLEAWVDGEVTVDESQALTRHVGACDACSREFELARNIAAGIRSLPELKAPASVRRNVLAAVESGQEHRIGAILPPTVRRPVWSVLAAAALVLAVAGGAIWQSRETNVPTDAEVARATAEARLALAYVGVASQRAASGLREELFHGRVVAPTLKALEISTPEGRVPEVSGNGLVASDGRESRS